jgi:hypothetical protein
MQLLPEYDPWGDLGAALGRGRKERSRQDVDQRRLTSKLDELIGDIKEGNVDPVTALLRYHSSVANIPGGMEAASNLSPMLIQLLKAKAYTNKEDPTTVVDDIRKGTAPGDVETVRQDIVEEAVQPQAQQGPTGAPQPQQIPQQQPMGGGGKYFEPPDSQGSLIPGEPTPGTSGGLIPLPTIQAQEKEINRLTNSKAISREEAKAEVDSTVDRIRTYNDDYLKRAQTEQQFAMASRGLLQENEAEMDSVIGASGMPNDELSKSIVEKAFNENPKDSIAQRKGKARKVLNAIKRKEDSIKALPSSKSFSGREGNAQYRKLKAPLSDLTRSLEDAGAPIPYIADKALNIGESKGWRAGPTIAAAFPQNKEYLKEYKDLPDMNFLENMTADIGVAFDDEWIPSNVEQAVDGIIEKFLVGEWEDKQSILTWADYMYRQKKWPDEVISKVIDRVQEIDYDSPGFLSPLNRWEVNTYQQKPQPSFLDIVEGRGTIKQGLTSSAPKVNAMFRSTK